MTTTPIPKTMTFRRKNGYLHLTLAGALAACSSGEPAAETAGSDPTDGCSGLCGDPGSSLSVQDVERVLAQGIAEALARQVNATLAVVDRVGNVLAVYRMGDPASRKVTLATQVDLTGNAVISGGLEGITLPVPAAKVNIDDQAAIAKAITGAYLSSEGNAFSTRTASQIVQEHFNPRENLQPAGPLFGVQFSQLACSDLMRSFDGLLPGVGPQRSPLGLAADPGGFPLYKNGSPVGGVGVMADGLYGLDPVITDVDVDIDEAIAYAATYGFAAPIDRRADRITADGKTLRFSDLDFADLRLSASEPPAFASIPAATGTLIKVTGYFDGILRAGTIFGQPSSGIRPDLEGMFTDQDAFVLVDQNNTPRYPPRSGTEVSVTASDLLSQAEVQALLSSALSVANRTRAQIRRPVGSQARVTISVVDTMGGILGVVRTRDAPVFGIDVSLQKARSAAFLSSSSAGSFLQLLPDAQYLSTPDPGDLQGAGGEAPPLETRPIPLGDYLTAAREFLGDQAAFTDNRPGGRPPIAYSARALGNISRPFFPDGINGQAPGPFSKPAGQWSVLSTGLQLDLSINAILQHVLFVARAIPTDVTPGCAGVNLTLGPPIQATPTLTSLRLANGLQIFPGGVPVYRGDKLVGAIGVSGDGVDQDDMIAFLGVDDASIMPGVSIANAPSSRRADTMSPQGVRLRYVQCPQGPFLDSDDQRPCAGK